MAKRSKPTKAAASSGGVHTGRSQRSDVTQSRGRRDGDRIDKKRGFASSRETTASNDDDDWLSSLSPSFQSSSMVSRMVPPLGGYVLPAMIALVGIFWNRRYKESVVAHVVSSLFGKNIPSNQSLSGDPPLLECNYVLAESSLGPHTGWGVFSLVDREPGDELLYSDLIVHLSDMLPKYFGDELAHVVDGYAWTPKYGIVVRRPSTHHQIRLLLLYCLAHQRVGVLNPFLFSSQEGSSVSALSPGLGMAANGGRVVSTHGDNGDHMVVNAISNLPTPPDPADLVRSLHPGAGSSTQYHERQFYAHRKILAGNEIFVNFGNTYTTSKLSGTKGTNTLATKKRVDELRRTGTCIDHIRPGLSAGKGRGAFATRFLPKGAVIAPFPVLPINRTSLVTVNHMTLQPVSSQLLLNYAFGHPNSSLLLYPYSPVSNYVNHGGIASANAEVRWSNSMVYDFDEEIRKSAAEVSVERRWGLMLELVALRDILEGDEVLIDYGTEWSHAWDRHKLVYDGKSEATRLEDNYVYASRFNLSEALVRTTKEQLSRPYPSNLEVSCFYDYAAMMRSETEWPDRSFDPQRTVTTAAWTETNALFRVSSTLRPCRVLERVQDELGTSVYRYTVEILNPSASNSEVPPIPHGKRHLVTDVPRKAIYFWDKKYTTDQNLPYAFRHAIGVPDGVYAPTWLDL